MSATNPEGERFYTVSQVGRMIGVSDQSVRRWVKAGELKAYKPKKEYRIAETDLQDFLEGRQAGPLAQAPLPDFDAQRRNDVDVAALDEAWAKSVRQQREFQMELLNARLGRAETEQEREEAYRNFKNWWVLLAQLLGTGFMHIPEMPGPALVREDEITVERVREFARRLYTNEAERDAELRTLEEAFTNEAHAASE